MKTKKQKIVQDFQKLSEDTKRHMRRIFPKGFSGHNFKYINAKGEEVTAVSFEIENKVYVIRLSRKKVNSHNKASEAFNEDVVLKKYVKDDYREKLDTNTPPIEHVDFNEEFF